MKIKTAIVSIIGLLLLVGSAGAATTGTVSATGPQVHVTSVELDPGTFYPFETGTITIVVSNDGNASATLYHATILDNTIHIKNEHSYDPMITLGSGHDITYSFVVSADGSDGTYFPLFTISFKDQGSLNYPIRVVVDSTDISAGISGKPDNFALSRKDKVNLSIINPRGSGIRNIIVLPEGPGLDVSPSQSFVSSLAGGSSVEIPFTVTPHQESDLTFHISYSIGDNKHKKDIVLPLNIGENKLAANPILTNIEIVSQGSSYQITGDVNNAGITDAKSMVLSVGPPAKGVEPYPDYAIGSLASDDFSSFELTFTGSDLTSVPVVISWKDEDGNPFSTTKNIDLRLTSGSGPATARTGSSGSSGTTGSAAGSSAARTGGGPPGGGVVFSFGGSRAGGISSFYPVIAGGIIAVIGIVLYMKRKWLKSKLKRK
jgi:hypothetical protein